ncbi:hypothetical protein COCNU_scaffold015939G000010 [Cocos nucifera]|nr:hypothetical protein [Cocos nucifera]
MVLLYFLTMRFPQVLCSIPAPKFVRNFKIEKHQLVIGPASFSCSEKLPSGGNC